MDMGRVYTGGKREGEGEVEILTEGRAGCRGTG